MARSFIIFLIVLVALVSFPSASAGQEITDVMFARDVVNMEPIAPFEPGTYCEKNSKPSGPIPVIDSQDERIVFLWTRIKSPGDGLVHHTWYKEGVQQAVVDLSLRESPGFRTWSSKNIDPNFHLGRWKVVVSADGDPNDVLCVAHFIVQ